MGLLGNNKKEKQISVKVSTIANEFGKVKCIKYNSSFIKNILIEFWVKEKTLGKELFENILQTTGIREKW